MKITTTVRQALSEHVAAARAAGCEATHDTRDGMLVLSRRIPGGRLIDVEIGRLAVNETRWGDLVNRDALHAALARRVSLDPYGVPRIADMGDAAAA